MYTHTDLIRIFATYNDTQTFRDHLFLTWHMPYRRDKQNLVRSLKYLAFLANLVYTVVVNLSNHFVVCSRYRSNKVPQGRCQPFSRFSKLIQLPSVKCHSLWIIETVLQEGLTTCPNQAVIDSRVSRKLRHSLRYYNWHPRSPQITFYFRRVT